MSIQPSEPFLPRVFLAVPLELVVTEPAVAGEPQVVPAELPAVGQPVAAALGASATEPAVPAAASALALRIAAVPVWSATAAGSDVVAGSAVSEAAPASPRAEFALDASGTEPDFPAASALALWIATVLV